MQMFNVTEGNTTKRIGRKPGEHYLKPMRMHEFLWEHNLAYLHEEHPWITDVKLVENPYLRNSLARANYAKKRVELSTKVMEGKVAEQRAAFIKAICHFISIKIFHVGNGEPYELLVNRYMKSTKKVYVPKTTVATLES